MIDLVSRHRCCNCARKRVWQSPSDDVARAFLGRKVDVSPGRSGPGAVGGGGTGACSLTPRVRSQPTGTEPQTRKVSTPQDPEIFDPGIFPPGSEFFSRDPEKFAPGPGKYFSLALKKDWVKIFFLFYF
jgi:hypothetical protein